MASRKSITVVIPYKMSWTQELIYALKSLKNVEHDDVLVIGDQHPIITTTPTDKPFWASYSSAHDQIAKYYHACQISDADELIITNDDIFIMQPWTPENYNRGTLEQHIKERGRSDSYTRQLQGTNKYLLARDMSNVSFELHTPMLVNREQFKHAIEELIPHISKSRQNVVLIRSYYGNRFNIDSTYMQDVKNPLRYKNMPIISTSDKTFSGAIGTYIKQRLS